MHLKNNVIIVMTNGFSPKSCARGCPNTVIHFCRRHDDSILKPRFKHNNQTFAYDVKGKTVLEDLLCNTRYTHFAVRKICAKDHYSLFWAANNTHNEKHASSIAGNILAFGKDHCACKGVSRLRKYAILYNSLHQGPFHIITHTQYNLYHKCT